MAQLIQSMIGPRVTIGGKPHLYFAGSSYHSLHARPEIIEAAVRATRSEGMGQASTRRILGSTTLQCDLESTASDFLGTTHATSIASGYLSTLAGLDALADCFDVVFVDESAHHSIKTAVSAPGKPVLEFPHRDAMRLGELAGAQAQAGNRPLIVTDSIFPGRGALAPIPDYVRIVETLDGHIWIDDAHGIGVLGQRGRGVCEHFGISSRRVHCGTTLSKAVGAYGGIIAGDAALDSRIRIGRVFSAAAPLIPAAVAAATAGLNLLKTNPQMMGELARNALHMKAQLRRLGIETDDTAVPIAAWELNSAAAMKATQQALLRQGVFIQYVEQYSGIGPHGALRAVVFSTHSKADIDQLMDALRQSL